jgi:ribonuclease BN (tRNA processing enzyme)
LKLSILGSSGTYPVPGRPASGYLVEHGATRIWCDAGPGTFMALPIDPNLIDAVVLSHEHPDHCLDLITAFHAFRYSENPRSHVPVFCPSPVSEKLLRFVDDHQDGGMAETFEFTTVDDGDEIEVGSVAISFVRSDHSVPTLATRWRTDGRILAYSADTGPEGDWMKAAEGADLFLCEASYQGEPGQSDYPYHLTAVEAGRIAREVGAKHLMLTHIPPHLEASRSVAEAEVSFDRAVELAVPGASRKV